jgi:ADP-ribosyl-[dinitrogen reductase] hydrolase
VLTRRGRIEGGLVGLLVGDALGVPYEFHPPGAIPDASRIEFEPPSGFRRAHAATPPGTWSDDGAQALCLLASLLECGRLDPDDLGRRLLSWHDHGEYAVDRRVYDVGIQTGRSLDRLRSGAAPLDAGTCDERSNGNGSLMRVLPLALWHRGGDAALAADARVQSRITHGHLRAQGCCALYCLWARRTLEGVASPWAEAAGTLRALHADEPAFLDELHTSIRPDDPAEGSGTGYVVDCLHSARRSVAAGPYEQVVKAAIALGHDTDTTACVAGGIAGLRDGSSAIPDRWRRALRGREWLDPLLNTLLAHAAS